MTFTIAAPSDLGVVPERLDALRERARREVDAGLLPSCQLAVARHGQLVLFETYGAATNDTRYAVFSATKPIVASVIWLLMADGLLDPARRVVDYFPEFAPHGKDAVTVEQVLLHTSGFPHAPMSIEAAADREARVERMAAWRLNWEPGTRFEYHPTSAHWVLAELIQRVTGHDFRDVVFERVTGPLGLGRVLGIARDDQDGIAELAGAGDPPSVEELRAAFGIDALDLGEVTEENLLRFNEPLAREVGVPGGGGIMTAAHLALFYQALLHDPAGLWDPAILADVTTRVRNTFRDPMTGVPANRSLGLVICGDDGKGSMRQGAFGKTCGPRSFGHGGAHGQIAWADPDTGLSFGYCTNGLDRHPVRHARRTIALSSLAALATTPV